MILGHSVEVIFQDNVIYLGSEMLHVYVQQDTYLVMYPLSLFTLQPQEMSRTDHQPSLRWTTTRAKVSYRPLKNIREMTEAR